MTPTFAKLFPWRGVHHEVPAIIGSTVPAREVRKVTTVGPVTIIHLLCTLRTAAPYIFTMLAGCLAWIVLQLMELALLARVAATLSGIIACLFMLSQLTSWFLARRERHFLNRWAPQIITGNSIFEQLLVMEKMSLTEQPIEELVDPEQRLIHMTSCVTNNESTSNQNVAQLLDLALQYRETRDPKIFKQAEWLHEAAHIMNEQRHHGNPH